MSATTIDYAKLYHRERCKRIVLEEKMKRIRRVLVTGLSKKIVLAAIR